MNEQGLAQQSQGQVDENMVMQVVQALMQGATPDELLGQNVPEEVIQMAIQIIQQEQAKQQQVQTQPTTQSGGQMTQGLAGMQ